ncbi:acyl-CoA N-acyltransferase [Phaeosphaeriaceae sp. PMI808]|nr:acyl-CoA N-acyltransferase [Phaeosphaeriaceae sp. PMI808]
MMESSMMYILIRKRNINTQARAETENELQGANIAKPMVLTASHNGSILGFTSFMFTYDDPPHQHREVVYMYEIHLQASLRGRGLGSRLVNFIDHAAHHCGISKTMLTVFKSNEGAQGLYKKLGYEKDACSPKDRVVRRRVIEADYVIMSKLSA